MDLTILTGALTGMKAIMDISKTLDDQKTISAINSAVADVQIKLITAQQQIMETQEENLALKRKLVELQDMKALEDTVSFHDGAYWRKKPDGSDEGPFCPSCWGLDKKLVYPSVSETFDSSAILCCTHHGKELRYFTVPTRLIAHLTP